MSEADIAAAVRQAAEIQRLTLSASLSKQFVIGEVQVYAVLLFIVSNDYVSSTYIMQHGIFIQSSLMSNPGLSYLTKEDIIQFSASAGTAAAPTSKSLRCGFRLLMFLTACVYFP